MDKRLFAVDSGRCVRYRQPRSKIRLMTSSQILSVPSFSITEQSFILSRNFLTRSASASQALATISDRSRRNVAVEIQVKVRQSIWRCRDFKLARVGQCQCSFKWMQAQTSGRGSRYQRSFTDGPAGQICGLMFSSCRLNPSRMARRKYGRINRRLTGLPQPIGELVPVGGTVVSGLLSATAESSGQGRGTAVDNRPANGRISLLHRWNGSHNNWIGGGEER